jgi:hypothetical protein
MNVPKYLFDLRFDPHHHLGMGDIRLTADQQNEISLEWAGLVEALDTLLQSHANLYKIVFGENSNPLNDLPAMKAGSAIDKARKEYSP